MKITTNRAWIIETVVTDDCLDIKEHHEDSDGTPRVVVPIEAVDELVFQLLKFKRKHDQGFKG